MITLMKNILLQEFFFFLFFGPITFETISHVRFLPWIFKYFLYYIVEMTLFLLVKMSSRTSHQRSSVRKGVLRNFAKFIGKKPVPESPF